MSNFIDSHINGQHFTGGGSEGCDVHNPATGEVLGTTRFAQPAEVNQCVEIAKHASSIWANTSPIKRARTLFRFNGLLYQHQSELAEIIAQEHGKTLDDAKGEVTRGIEVVEFACGIPQLLKGEYSENVGTQVDTHSIRQPLGVVAGITPFNFPAMVPMWMFPMALACGNSFILKPSEKVPTASLMLAQLIKKAGCPDGVFNVLQGNKDTVNQLLEHRDIDAISFVGSTPVARHIYAQGTSHSKRVQALGGAKNHMVIMPDADLDAAVNGLIGAAYGSAGERCMAISVAVAVGERTADELTARLLPAINALKIGGAMESGVEMGPLISQQHRQKVLSYIETGVQEGASLLVDGRQYQATGENSHGFFLGASLFDHVTAEMRIYQEEIFGPVLCIVRADDYEHALSMVNMHPFGNGTAIFTQSGAIARDFSTRVTAGMVGVNVPIPVPVAYHSFGGWKSSLFGDHHIYGSEGVRFYTRAKAVTSRWNLDSSSDFVMPTLE